VFPEILDGLTVSSVADRERDIGVGRDCRDAVYAVTLPDEIDTIYQSEEGTVASEIASKEGTVAATFDSDCAREYPSLRFLLPGDPIFEQLVDQICSATDVVEYDWMQFGFDWTANEQIEGRCPWVVGGLLDNGHGVVLDEDGSISETVIDVKTLEEWSREFILNRISN
jgi:hypothetical protein